MTQSGNVPDVPRKLLASGPLKIRIAVGSLFILTVGAWLAPRATQQRTLSPPEERPAPLIEEQVQRREAGRLFTGVQDIGAQVRLHGVSIPASTVATPSTLSDYSDAGATQPRIAGFGVFVSNVHVLTHASALNGRRIVPLVTADARTVDGEVMAYEPTTGLVLLRTNEMGTPAPILTAAAPPAGALLVGAVRSGPRDIAMPVFITAVGGDRFTIGGTGAELPPGMPVYTMDGELFAIAGADEGGVRAIPAREGAGRLLAREAEGERLSSFGVAVQAMDQPLAAVFGQSGVLVAEVIPGGPADLAEVQAGDVLLSIGGVAVSTPGAAMDALHTVRVGQTTTLGLRRARREFEIVVAPSPAYEVAALARRNEPTATGLDARAVFSPEQLDAAAIPPAARVMAIDGNAVTSRTQVQRLLRVARRPAPALLRHEGRQFFAALEPAR